MTENFVGCEVSVEVGGGLGYYQGRVISVNKHRQTITITRVIHNGRPAALNEITINAGDIKDLKILAQEENGHKSSSTDTKQKQPLIPHCLSEQYVKSRQPQVEKSPLQEPQTLQHQHQESRQPHSSSFRALTNVHGATNDTQQPRRKPRTSVGETLAHGTYSTTLSRESGNDWQRINSAPSLSQEYNSPRRNDRYNNNNDIYNKTPNRKERSRRNRDETTFGTPVDDDMLSTEFDFEKNLALFDKQAVIEEIQSLKPDVVRQADRFTEKKNYRCDENVIPSKPVAKMQIIVPPSGAAEVVYANDSGLLVPSITSDLRAALLSTANQHGLTNSRQLEMIGRAATELILSISGCNHRLEPGNRHQPPVVVILCGCHLQGAAGVNTARQLQSHGVRTIVMTPQLPSAQPPPLLLTHELQLYDLTNGTRTSDQRGITSTLDLIVDARLDHSGRVSEGNLGHSWLSATSLWASTSRAPILALDPPSDLAAIPSTQPPLPARVLLCPALPLAYTPARGKVYLLNMPIPQQIFTSVGIKYVSPFGAKLVIPLHPCE